MNRLKWLSVMMIVLAMPGWTGAAQRQASRNPRRPNVILIITDDQGFHQSLTLNGGGIGQPSDPPGGVKIGVRDVEVKRIDVRR
ncbi:MAG: hypothetical protein MOB07_02175 [Acidobacteria bacterium]|nr:hypothetical protein [Acidobacteriota bacterium]